MESACVCVCVCVCVTQVPVEDGLHVAWLYVTSWRFFVDMISTVPFVYLVRLHCSVCVCVCVCVYVLT